MKLYKLPIDNIIDQLGYRASSNLFFITKLRIRVCRLIQKES